MSIGEDSLNSHAIQIALQPFVDSVHVLGSRPSTRPISVAFGIFF